MVTIYSTLGGRIAADGQLCSACERLLEDHSFLLAGYAMKCRSCGGVSYVGCEHFVRWLCEACRVGDD